MENWINLFTKNQLLSIRFVLSISNLICLNIEKILHTLL